MQHNKHSIILILLAVILAGCGETDNEDHITNVFIGGGSIDTVEAKRRNYNSFVPAESIYREEFNSSTGSIWFTGSDQWGTYSISGGVYRITGKQNFYYPMEISPSPTANRDFQIEMYIQSDFKNVLSSNQNQVQGMFLETGNSDRYCFGMLSNNDNPVIIRRFSPTPTTDLYKGKLSSGKIDDWHLFTVRKIGNQLYFFLNKRYLYRMDGSIIRSYGPNIANRGVVSIDWIRIDYIREQ